MSPKWLKQISYELKRYIHQSALSVIPEASIICSLEIQRRLMKQCYHSLRRIYLKLVKSSYIPEPLLKATYADGKRLPGRLAEQTDMHDDDRGLAGSSRMVMS
jgi:hypothetical protein